MSLFALPVTMADLTQLQLGIQFFTNNAEATAEVATINAGTDTVSAYANKLLNEQYIVVTGGNGSRFADVRRNRHGGRAGQAINAIFAAAGGECD